MSDEQQQAGTDAARSSTEKPEVTDEHRQQAKEMAKAYDETRPTSTLPGSDGTVSGTAVTEWLDDEDKGKVETTGQQGVTEAERQSALNDSGLRDQRQ